MNNLCTPSLRKALLAFLLCFSGAFAQNAVDIITQIPPPYSPYYSDYFEGKNNTMLIVRNNDAVSRRIRLEASIVGDNGISIKTSPGRNLSTPLTLDAAGTPGATKTLIGTTLQTYFTAKVVDVTGIDRNTLLRIALLPEGNYELCFRAYDYETGAALSAESPFGCANFTVAYPEPPILIEPFNGDTVKVASSANSILFSWIGSTSAPVGSRYRLQIVEMPNPAANPNQVMDAATNFYFQKEMTTTNYIALPNDPNFINGRTYAWRVVAYDPANRIPFRNKGKSESWKFTYVIGNPLTDSEQEGGGDVSSGSGLSEGKIEIVNPDCSGSGASVDGFELKIPGGKSFPKKGGQDGAFDKSDGLPLVAVNNGRDFYILWKNLSKSLKPDQYVRYKAIFSNYSGAPVTTMESVKLSGDNNTESDAYRFAFVSAPKSEAELYFKSGERYKVRVEAYDAGMKKIAESTECTFRFRITADTTLYAGKAPYEIRGNLVYTFQNHVDEYPIMNGTAKLRRLLLLKDTITGNILADSVDPSSVPGVAPGAQFVDAPVAADGSFKATVYSGENGGLVGPGKVLRSQANKTEGKTGAGLYATGNFYEYYQLELNNSYFEPIRKRIELNSDSINVGKLSTRVFSYTLKIIVDKGYKTGNYKDLNPKGVEAELIRIGRKDYIPYYEGDVKLGDPITETYQIKQVAKGVVSEEVGPDGKTRTVVTFDKLVVNWTNEDKYTLSLTQKAVKDGKEVTYPSNFMFYSQRFTPDPFIYNFVVLMNGNTNFKVDKKATIISPDPPTASVSGQLLIKDPTNPTANVQPLAGKSVALVVTYYVENGAGDTTMLDYYHIRRAMWEKSNSAVTGQDFGNLNTIDNTLKASFPDKDQVLATATTDGQGRFSFKNFAHVDSLGGWQGKSEFGTGPIEFKTIANISGYFHRTLRVIVSGDRYKYLNPDKDIIAQPLDSVNVGALTALYRTYTLQVTARKDPSETTQSEPGGVVYGAKIKIAQSGNSLPPSDYKYVQSTIGASFNGLFYHQMSGSAQYVNIFTATSDTVGENSYEAGYYYYPSAQPFNTAFNSGKRNVSKQIPPWTEGGGSLNGVPQINLNTEEEFNRGEARKVIDEVNGQIYYTGDYVPTTIHINAYMYPKKPIISGRVLDASNPMRAVEGGVVFLWSGLDKNDMTIASNGVRFVSEKNQSGYFVFKDLPIDLSFLGMSAPIYYRVQTIAGGYAPYSAKMVSGAVNSFMGIMLSKDTTRYNNISDGFIPPKPDGVTLRMGQQIHFPQILMQPKGKVYGYIINENDEIVDSYVRSSHGKMSSSGWLGMFSVAVPTGYADTLFIIPKDLRYFNDTIKITGLTDANPNLNLGKIIVKERRHRIRITLVDNDNHLVAGAKVRILDNEQATNGGGIASFNFKNASLKNFWVKVTPPPGSSYIPISMELTNEESKGEVDYRIDIDKGYTIAGIVRINGYLAKDAEIYVVDAEGNQVNSVKTSSAGGYTLRGIRPFYYEPGGPQTQAHIPRAYVKCVAGDAKAGSQDFSNALGESKKVTFGFDKNKTYEVNFDLRSFDAANITKLYGFDVKVHKVDSLAPDKFKISGALDLSSAAGAFELIDAAQYVGFSNVAVKTIPTIKDSRGRPYLQVDAPGGNAPLDAVSLKVRLTGTKSAPKPQFQATEHGLYNYNVKLEAVNFFAWEENTLELSRESEISGYIHSNARIVDNSFNFPGSYFRFEDDQFYLQASNGESSGGGNTFTNVMDNPKGITSFRANTDTTKNHLYRQLAAEQGSTYYLSSAGGGPLSFKFLEFSAKSERKNNYISSAGHIYLKPKAWSDIRLDPQNPASVKKIELELPQVHLTADSLYSSTNIAKVEIKLEEWTLEARNCSVSPSLGGLATTDAVIHTKALDIPIGEFNLRHDFLYMAKPQLDNLPLGGNVATLKVPNSKNAQFGLDPKVGMDLKPHYKLILVGSPAAQVEGIDAFNGKKLTFQAVSLLSNGETIISFDPASERLPYRGVGNFKPLTIQSYQDKFYVDGLIDFDIPRVPQGITCKLAFSRSGSTVVDQYLPTNINFEAPGYVKFKSIANTDKQVIVQNNLKFYGSVEEPGKLEPIRVILEKAVSGGVATIKIYRDETVGTQYLTLGSGAEAGKFIIDKSDMAVANKDWKNLKLKLTPTGEFAAKGFGSEPLNFVVYGDISLDPDVSGQQIKISGINIPGFGEMQMLFDLPNKRFLGSLTIEKKQLGAATIAGAAEINVDPHGFYFVAAGEGSVQPMGPFSVGILVGSYNAGIPGGVPQSAREKVLSFSIGKGLPCDIENKTEFKGIFLTGRKAIPFFNYEASIDVVIASASLKTEAGFEASAWVNLAEPRSGGVSLMMYALCNLTMSSITCTSLEAGAEGVVKGEAKIIGSAFELGACASLNINGSIKQEIPTLVGCEGEIFSFGGTFISLKADITANSSTGFNASLGTGSCAAPACSSTLPQ